MIEIKKEAVFKLGNCEVNPSDNSLNFSDPNREGIELTKVSVQPKFIELLSYLARQYPRVVPRDELIDKIWEGNVYVGTKALTNAIWHLRKHLNPLLEGEQAIETVRKMGYRLLISPEFDESDLVDEPDLYQQEQAKVQLLTILNRRLLTVGLITFTLFCLFSLFHLYQDSVRYTPTERQNLTLAAGAELYPAVSPDG